MWPTHECFKYSLAKVLAFLQLLHVSVLRGKDDAHLHQTYLSSSDEYAWIPELTWEVSDDAATLKQRTLGAGRISPYFFSLGKCQKTSHSVRVSIRNAWLFKEAGRHLITHQQPWTCGSSNLHIVREDASALGCLRFPGLLLWTCEFLSDEALSGIGKGSQWFIADRENARCSRVMIC